MVTIIKYLYSYVINYITVTIFLFKIIFQKINLSIYQLGTPVDK